MVAAGVATKPPAALFKAHCAAVAGAIGVTTGVEPATGDQLNTGEPAAKVLDRLSTAWKLVAVTVDAVFLTMTL